MFAESYIAMKISSKNILLVSGSVIFGGVFGYILSKKVNEPKINTCGNLRIDNSEPNEPSSMFLEVTDYDALQKSDYITLKVIKANYSH